MARRAVAFHWQPKMVTSSANSWRVPLRLGLEFDELSFQANQMGVIAMEKNNQKGKVCKKIRV
jgi:hypothetical protein